MSNKISVTAGRKVWRVTGLPAFAIVATTAALALIGLAALLGLL